MTFPLKLEARMPLHVSIGKPITAPDVVAISDGDSKSANPLVSLVIPCYKQAQYLGRAIESVLNQSYRDFEIIVVDDGSPDNTRRIALRYPSVKYILQRNKGNAAARNTGWRASTGEFTVFLDADDVLYANALQAGVDALRDNPDVALTSGLCRVLHAETGKGYKQKPLTAPASYLELLKGNFIWHPASAMFRRSVLESGITFNENFYYVADLELYFTVARTSKISAHNELVSEYIKHEGSITSDVGGSLKVRLAVCRAQSRFIKGVELKAAYEQGIGNVYKIAAQKLIDELIRQNDSAAARKIARELLGAVAFNPRAISNVLDTFRQADEKQKLKYNRDLAIRILRLLTNRA